MKKKVNIKSITPFIFSLGIFFSLMPTCIFAVDTCTFCYNKKFLAYISWEKEVEKGLFVIFFDPSNGFKKKTEANALNAKKEIFDGLPKGLKCFEDEIVIDSWTQEYHFKIESQTIVLKNNIKKETPGRKDGESLTDWGHHSHEEIFSSDKISVQLVVDHKEKTVKYGIDHHVKSFLQSVDKKTGKVLKTDVLFRGILPETVD